MSDRDPVERLAADIAYEALREDDTIYETTLAELIEEKVRVFLAEREAELAEEIVRDYEDLKTAEGALRHHGYRKSCDIPACNCGDQWMHGGLAEAHLREIREELGELANGKTILGAVKDLRAELAREGGEGA